MAVKPGQKVHVEFDGIVKYVNTQTSWAEVSTPDGPGASFTAYVPVSSLTVVKPAVRAGQVWEADNCRWFVREGTYVGIQFVPNLPARGTYSEDNFWEQYPEATLVLDV